MLSNKLTFSLASLIVLLVAALCMPIVAQAQQAAGDVVLIQAVAFDGDGDGNANDPDTGIIPDGDTAVYGNAALADAMLNSTVRYTTGAGLPSNLAEFFNSDWMIEVIAHESLNLDWKEFVISEIMWGIDEAATALTAKQWIEFYNASGDTITIPGSPTFNTGITLLFTHFPTSIPTNYINAADATDLAGLRTAANGDRKNAADEPADRKGKAITADDPHTHVVVDRLSNLEFDDLGFKGRWADMPGQSGRLTAPTSPDGFPQVPIISMNRKIDYNKTPRKDGVGDGVKRDQWVSTDSFARRGTTLSLLIANPGMALTPVSYVRGTADADPPGDTIVINEVRNSMNDDLDWIEIKNVMDPSAEEPDVNLKDWEIALVTKENEGIIMAHFPDYELGAQEILLIVNRDPSETQLAGGVDVNALVEAEDQLQKGAQHRYVVDSRLVLPNDKDNILLLLRNAKDKNKAGEWHNNIQDVAGGLEQAGYAKDPAGGTQVWPFRYKTKLGDDLVGTLGKASQTAWERKPKGAADDDYYIVENTNGRHKGAWNEVSGSDRHGIGYDRNVDLDFAPGTPGYENMIANTIDDHDDTKPDPDGMEIALGTISISEIMYDAGPRWNLVQWIELYNASMTQSVNLAGWELEIRNATDEVESYVDSSFIFEDAVILPNQTLLLVSGPGANDVPENRVYNLYEKHRRSLGLTTRRSVLLSPTGFYLKLTDKADIKRDDRTDQDVVADEAGNVMVDGASRIVEWELPARGDVRQSLVRQYGTSKLDGTSDPADDGTMVDSWEQSDIVGAGLAYFGHRDDVGTPGYRLGGPLPVSLSSFRPVRDKATGEVVITWVTESELNNAGFNILRSETKTGEFKVINLQGIIAGHGTTSEKHVYSYIDKTAKPNVAYYYQIEDVSLNGNRTTLRTTHMRGNVNASGKLTTRWSELKSSDR